LVRTACRFFFPGRKALIDGRTAIPVQPSQPDGKAGLPRPAGSHTVELRPRMNPGGRDGWLPS